MISCAAILALKFNMLRRLDVDEKMINRTLLTQIGIFFMFLLILAIIHSIFGIIFSNIILKTMGINFNLKAVIITAILIYLYMKDIF